jgi:hypothetical protein
MAKQVRLYHPAWEKEGRLFDKDHAERILAMATPNTKISSKKYAGEKRHKRDSSEEEE